MSDSVSSSRQLRVQWASAAAWRGQETPGPHRKENTHESLPQPRRHGSRHHDQDPAQVAASGPAWHATAEYAVGILAAVTLALVLFKVFQDAKFFKAFLGLVLKAVSFVTGMIK